MPRQPLTGLVLGGGGGRGAYEVGVLLGMHEVLTRHGVRLAFDVLCGSSIGALNVVWLGAHAHEPDLGIPALLEEWVALRLEDSVRLHRRGGLKGLPAVPSQAPSLLDASALESLMRERVPWTQLHYNVASGTVQAVIVTALNIATGRTTAFTQLAPQAYYRPTRDPRRDAELVRMRPEHALASSAFPWLLPARQIDGSYYCDGGLRYNTPISPALRAGAERLVVVSLLAAEAPSARHVTLERQRLAAFPTPVFLLGKLLAALLLDPIQYDLQVLERFNKLVDVLETELEPDELERVRDVLTKTRGVPYRRVPTLVFQPSRNIGAMTSQYLERHARPSVAARALKYLSRLGRTYEADLMSFILLDGGFAAQLAELGRADVHAREAEVVAFFTAPPA